MNPYDFFLAGSLEKVLPAKRPRPLEDGAVIPVFPGTIPAVQLVYCRRRAEKRRPFTITVEGAPVPPSLCSVELVPVDFPANDKADAGYITLEPAMLPDLLVPLDGNQVYPQPELYNAVWISFSGIGAASQGRHEVRVKAASDEYAAELRLILDVLDEALPPQNLLHSQWFHTDCLANYYRVEPLGEAHWEIIDAFMAPMNARYGINTLLTPVFTPPLDTAVGAERPTVQLADITAAGDTYTFDFRKFSRWCGLCKKHGISHLEIAHLFTQWGAKSTPKIMAKEDGREKRIFGWDVPAGSAKYRRFLEQFLPALRRACEAEGFDQNHTIFHVSDEPGAAEIADYRRAKAQAADLLEGCLIMDALSDFSFYKKGIVEHPIPANDAIAPFLEAEIPGLWVYYCVAQSVRVPNRFIALPSPRLRAMGVLMYRWRIAGLLHWGYNYYYSALSKHQINPFLKTGGLKDWPAGDPFLVYPGDDRKPLASIRGEVHRESLEDMRILALVEAKAGRDAALGIISEGFAGELNFDNYPLDPAYYTGLRERAARIIRGAAHRSG